jgi:transposase
VKDGEGRHADKWILHWQNVGRRMSIDETSMSRGDLHTFLTNKEGRGQKGTMAAMIEGTDSKEIIEVLMKVPQEARDRVEEITMDFSDSMHAIATACFPNARITIDLFHLIRLALGDLQDYRVSLKREAKKAETAEGKVHKQRLAKDESKREAEKTGTGGKKQERANAAYKPFVYEETGDTLCELLARSRYLLNYTRDEWTPRQKKRAGLLFRLYPKLEVAYNLVHRLRMIFKNHKLNKETAKPRLEEWCNDAEQCGVDEFQATVDTIREREDEVLNYFVNFETNASAESFNAKIKHFRAQLRGISDEMFFRYRLCELYG